MKRFFKWISEFLDHLTKQDEALGVATKLLRTDRDNWTEVENHEYGEAQVLRYEGEGEFFGTLIVLEMLTSKIVLKGCEYGYFLDGSVTLHQALNPVLRPPPTTFSDMGPNRAFDA